ncbi:MAG: pilus assembly protein PilP [Chlorobi bacterium]|nr:pilus assembly protein PilP [Chlorobiota bacterium]
MRTKLLFIAVFTMSAFMANAQSLTINKAINKAGRQRMLTQRMTKDYLMIGAGVKVESAQKELDDAVALFEEQFLELEDFAPNDQIADSLESLNMLWMEFRMEIVSAPELDKAATMIDKANILLKASNQIVVMLQEYAGSSSGNLVNIAGRQRMLSQRIAMYYTAYYWGVKDPGVETNLEAAIQEFETANSTLSKSNANTEDISKRLVKVGSQWDFSKKGFDLKSERLMPSIVFVTTNSILKKMNTITGLYSDMEKS